MLNRSSNHQLTYLSQLWILTFTISSFWCFIFEEYLLLLLFYLILNLFYSLPTFLVEIGIIYLIRNYIKNKWVLKIIKVIIRLIGIQITMFIFINNQPLRMDTSFEWYISALFLILGFLLPIKETK